jgi:hypothetical protein
VFKKAVSSEYVEERTNGIHEKDKIMINKNNGLPQKRV